VNDPSPHRGWEYAVSGEYHIKLDPNWSYTPTYLRKMAEVRAFIQSRPAGAAIVDLGCGEGVLVREFRAAGREISGIDMNYEGEGVTLGDVRHTALPESSFDVAMMLDVFEHLAFEDQPATLDEVRRILRPGGTLLLSVPNLAHFNSRVTFLLKGRLDRTDIETNHPGERPLGDYERLLDSSGFAIERRLGITFTAPILYRHLICRHPAALRWLHDLMEPLARALPALAMLTLFECRRS
jgi:SAM-dependent methyltransferase